MKITNAVDFNEPTSAARVGSELQSTALSLSERVRQTADVTDLVSLEQAALDRQALGDAIKRVEEFFKPLKAMADQLHKALCSREREILEPLRSADVAKVDAIKRYHLTEQRERQRRQDAEAEARRRDDQDRAAIEAARLEEQGEHALAAAVVEEAIAAPTPVVVYPDPVAAVVSFTRRWKWKYQHGPADITKTPPQLVARALALVPKEFLCLDEKKVGAYARSMKTTGHIPGIDIYAVDEPNR
jgi:hypothetical protein